MSLWLFGFTQYSDFRVQTNAKGPFHGALDVENQSLQIRRGGITLVEKEIRVLCRYAGAADAETFQAGGFDQARGVVAGRIFECRSAAPGTDGLRFFALVE